MNKTLLSVLRWIGFGLFFVLALLIFVRLTFPTGPAKELVRSQLSDALGADEVEIAELGISGLLPSGVTLEGTQITLPAVKLKTPERGVDIDGPPRLISIDELAVSGSLMGLMSQSYDVELEAQLQGGHISGARLLWDKGSPLSLEVAEIADVGLGSEQLFLALTGFDVLATLSGRIKVELPMGDGDGKPRPQLDQLVGSVELALSDARVMQPVVDTKMNGEMVRMAFTDTSLGTVQLKLKAGEEEVAGVNAKARRRNVLEITELVAEGGDVQISTAPNATITLTAGQPLKHAVINLHLAVRIDDGWFDIEVKDPKNPGKMTKPNVGVRTMISMGALKKYMQDGQFGIGITGQLSKPRVQLERPRTRAGGPAGRRVNVEQPPADHDEPDEVDEPEDEDPTRAVPRASRRAAPRPVVHDEPEEDEPEADELEDEPEEPVVRAAPVPARPEITRQPPPTQARKQAAAPAATPARATPPRPNQGARPSPFGARKGNHQMARPKSNRRLGGRARPKTMPQLEMQPIDAD